MKIKCRLCENEYGIKQLGMHISRTHKIPYQEYAQMYWEDLPNWAPCSECGTVCKSTYCSDECYKSGQLKFLKNREVTTFREEHKKKISEAAKKRFSNPEKHPMYGKHHSNNSKQKIGKSQSKRLKEDGHWATGSSLSEETKQKISETRIEREVAKGENNPMFGKTHTPETIKKIFSYRKMNGLEKIVADYFDENGVEYDFQFFITEAGVCKSYDFRIKNTNIIIEIDGDYWHGGPGVLQHCPNVEQVKENDIIKNEIAEKRGFNVNRIWESELMRNIKVLDTYIKTT